MIGWIFSFLGDTVDVVMALVGLAILLAATFLKPLMLMYAPALAASPLVGAARSIGQIVGFVVFLYFSHHMWLRRHDDALIADWSAAQERAVSDAVKAAEEAGRIATKEAEDAAREQALRDAPVREVIRHVPIQMSCAASPAVSAVLDELRRQAGSRPGQAKPAN